MREQPRIQVVVLELLLVSIIQYRKGPLLILFKFPGMSGYAMDGGVPAKPSGFWTVEYYQPYFDVDTKTVRQLCPVFSIMNREVTEP